VSSPDSPTTPTEKHSTGHPAAASPTLPSLAGTPCQRAPAAAGRIAARSTGTRLRAPTAGLRAGARNSGTTIGMCLYRNMDVAGIATGDPQYSLLNNGILKGKAFEKYNPLQIPTLSYHLFVSLLGRSCPKILGGHFEIKLYWRLTVCTTAPSVSFWPPWL
jgi:hypothetical protein